MSADRRFKGIVRDVTLSRGDMIKLLNIPLAEIDEWSPVRVVILPDKAAIVRAMAVSMVDKVKENNRQGKITTFILPVGPRAQYPIAAEISNGERVSWQNVWTFNMDEYLDWEGRPIPEDHPMSFHRFMRRNFFELLDAELSVPEGQRWFPDPFAPDAIDEKIEEITGGKGVDICYGGIGEHGHLAFNEAPDLVTHYMHITPEEFKNSKTRVLSRLNPETLARAFRSPMYTLCPPGAITLGMKVILGAKAIELRSRRWVSLKIAAMHPPTMDFPATFIQEHPNPKETVTIYASRQEW